MLSCCHSFCTQCIQFLTTEGPGASTLICPFCHQTTPVPKGGITSLPRNLRLLNKQSFIFSKITTNPPPLCDSCSEDTSVAYCTECNEVICKKCWTNHQLLSITRSHVIQSFEDFKKMSRDEVTKLIPSFTHTCQDHSDHQLKYYCQQCIIPVCIECTIINHKDHPVTEVSKQVNSNKATVIESIQGFQVAQQQLKEVLISGEEVKKKINARKNEIDTIIRQTFTTFQQLLHEREEALLAKSSEVANAKEVRLNCQLEGIQRLLETMTYCENLATSAVETYDDVEILSMAHTLQTRANQLQQEFSETSLEVCESPTISVDINTDELATKIANLDITFNEISPRHPTTVIPFNDVLIDKESTVRVIYRGSKGKKLSKRDAVVSGRLVPVKEKGTPIEAKTRDCGDGTFLVSMRPQQLGEHTLFLTVEGQPIQGCPFNVSVVGSRDYTTLNKPVQTITKINHPWFIAFSNNADIFVTSYTDHCIYVFDSSGRQKTTIGSYGSGALQFNSPSGIAINGDVMYVAEIGGNRVQKLTLGGEYLATFGRKGSGKRKFSSPWGICIGPDDRIYVADKGNHRIQVFRSDHTFSHFIHCNVIVSGEKAVYDLSFDNSGHLHVTTGTGIVTVFTPEGEYIRQYGESHLNWSCGIAIDSTGNSLVVDSNRHYLSIFDPHGNYIHSIGGFYNPTGVAVASNGSVWVADRNNHRLVKY